MPYLLTLLLFTLIETSAAKSKEPPLRLEKAEFNGDFAPGGNGVLKLYLSLKPEHKAYVDRFELHTSQWGKLKSTKLKLTPLRKFHDPHSEKIRDVVTQDFRLEALIEIPEKLKRKPASLELELRYQACTLKYCYTPKTLKFEVPRKSSSQSFFKRAISLKAS